MTEERVSIVVRPGIEVSALHTTPETRTGGLQLVYAPGAGSNLNDPFGVYLSAVLAEAGIESWRFQFPYMERGRGGPDAAALLAETWRVAIDHAIKTSGLPIIASGRSMGGRVASLVAAAGAPVAALALFAYPLMPPGRSSDRTSHFANIQVPTLFCSGDRDSFGTPAQLESAATLIAGARLHTLEGADHGFAVLKSSGRKREDVWHKAAMELISFIESLTPTQDQYDQ